MIIGICGRIGAGKDTIALHLIEKYGYQKMSWASSLKDMCASLFSWDRTMLEGQTDEARQTREQVDEWWAQELGMPNFSPRLALQQLGTDVMRNHFSNDIWVASLKKKMIGKDNIVISDVRFNNEIAAIRDLGGQIWEIERGQTPRWVEDLSKLKSIKTNHPIPFINEVVDDFMKGKYPSVHSSEYSWHGVKPNILFHNDGPIEALKHQVDDAMDVLSVIGNDVPVGA